MREVGEVSANNRERAELLNRINTIYKDKHGKDHPIIEMIKNHKGAL
jgi:hypothetical protein